MKVHVKIYKMTPHMSHLNLSIDFYSDLKKKKKKKKGQPLPIGTRALQ